MFDRPFRHLAFTATAFLAMSSVAQAKLWCVADTQQLRSALTTAQSSVESDEIRLVSGYITTDLSYAGVRWRYQTSNSGDLDMSGGWNGACTAHGNDPSATRLNAASFGPAFELVVDAGASPGIRFSRFTVQDGVAPDFQTVGGLSVRVASGAAPSIRLERLILFRNASLNPNGGGLGASVSGGQLYVLGNWILMNDATSAAGGALTAIFPGTVYFNHNTVTMNRSDNPNGVGGFTLAGVGTYWLANNVLHGNTRQGGVPSDLRVDDGLGILRNNHIGALAGTPGSNSGMSSGDPRFTPGGYDAPTALSPLRNCGFPTPNGGLPSTSFLGDERVAGGTVDRGAFEFQEIFGNSFD